MASFFKLFLILTLLSAIPIAYIIHSETSPRATHVYEYHSRRWLRDCTKWDDLNRRFIVSFFEGGLGVIPVMDNHPAGGVLEEIPVVVGNPGLEKNSSLGFAIDRPRNRVVVAIGDVLGFKYSAVAAYDLTTWNRLFLTQLSSTPDVEEKTLADDVAVDAEGNAYITDAKGNKIWKVGPNGEVLYSIKSPLFTPNKWYHSFIGVNGIVHHPDGYLLVAHTLSGKLFKIETGKGTDEVKVVNTTGSLRFSDGMELVSPTKLVIAGMPSGLMESWDEWESARMVGKFSSGAAHRLVTAATVKDGKVYLNHMVGLGYPRRKHLLVEAVFYSSLDEY